MGSGFFDCDGADFTNFNAALTTKAFFCIHRGGFAVNHFKYFNRTYIYAFFATFTFVFINNGIKSHLTSLLSSDNYGDIIFTKIKSFGQSPYINYSGESSPEINFSSLTSEHLQQQTDIARHAYTLEIGTGYSLDAMVSNM
jgi:hypothetical protein